MLNFKKFSPKQLWILLLLLPMLIFILHSVIIHSSHALKTDTFYKINIHDTRQNEFEIDSKSNAEDTANFLSLISSGIEVPASPTLDSASAITLEISGDNGTEKNITLFFFVPDKSNGRFACAYFDNEKIYVAQNQYSDKFVSSKYALSLYPSSIPPTLTTYSLDTVIPRSISWQYKCADQSLMNVEHMKTTSEHITYFQNGKMDFSFSIKPTSAYISISDSEGSIYIGSLENLAEQNIDSSGTLYVNINATWDFNSNADYSGNASYDFVMEYMAPAQFNVSSSAVSAGGYVIVSGINISDPTKIKLSSEPQLAFNRTFVGSETNAFAVIPIPLGTAYKAVTFKMQYGEITKEIPVTIDHLDAGIPVEISVDKEIVEKYHTSDSITEYGKLTKEICSKVGLEYPLGSVFDDPSEWKNAELFLRVSDLYKVNGSYTSVSYENHYSMPLGSSIFALSGGMIDAVGFCDILGNYVVIDHGMGIRTWYGHLSEITVKTGDLVNRGDIIGRAGSSGYAFTCGTSVSCTIGSVTVTLDEIIKDGIYLTAKKG